MKPKTQRRILAEAYGLADEVLARLAARGVPAVCMPDRDVVVGLVLPLAYRLHSTRKLVRQAQRTHSAAAELLGWQEARRAARLDRLVASFAAVPLPPVAERVAGSVPFDPAAWRLALAPAAGARVREVA